MPVTNNHTRITTRNTNIISARVRGLTQIGDNPMTTNPYQLLNNPHILTVSLAVAAQIVGVARSTATDNHKRNGYLMPGVPVIKIGSRCIVSTTHLRAALGIAEPVNPYAR